MLKGTAWVELRGCLPHTLLGRFPNLISKIPLGNFSILYPSRSLRTGGRELSGSFLRAVVALLGVFFILDPVFSQDVVFDDAQFRAYLAAGEFAPAELAVHLEQEQDGE